MGAKQKLLANAPKKGTSATELTTAANARLTNTFARRGELTWTSEGLQRRHLLAEHARTEAERFLLRSAARAQTTGRTNTGPAPPAARKVGATRTARGPPARNDTAPVLAVAPVRATVEQPLTIDDANFYRLIDRAETQRLSGTKNSSMYAAIAAGKFPAPVKVGRNSRWVLGEVISWTKSLCAQRISKS